MSNQWSACLRWNSYKWVEGLTTALLVAGGWLHYRERQEIIAKSPISFSYLKRFNLGAGILHLSQGILMLALGTLLTWERDLYTFYLKFDETLGPPPVFNIAPDPQVW